MAKYIFIAPHTIGTEQVINKQGVLLAPATTIKVFKIGDIIEGKVHTYPTMGISTQNLPKFIDTIINEKTYLIPPELLKEYTEESLPTSTNKSTSNDSKKTITIVLVVVAVLGLLKLKKVI